jgi:hypothetical protein
MTEISKSLERYYKNKERYNERAKKYYNEVWYPKNKERIKREKREKKEKENNIKNKNILKKKIIYTTNDKKLIIDFD